MKKFANRLFFIVCVLISFGVHAQVIPTISQYDDESIRTFNVPELLKNFENALNIISYSGSEQLDIKTVSDNLIMDGELRRSFYNNLVMIESDLSSNSYLSLTKEDIDIKKYLDAFNVLYIKTQNPTISFHVLKISSLKKKTYFFYNVLFESTFNNIDNSGIPYKTTNRIAEVRLDYDTTWNAYIQAIRFEPKNFNINSNKDNFNDFVTQFDQTTQYKLQQIEFKKEQQREARVKINQLIADGDNFVLQADFLHALEKYKAAWSFDTYDENVKDKIENCEELLKSEKSEQVEAEDLQQTILSLKKHTLKLFSSYYFAECKRYRDSLTVYYNQTNDSSLTNIANHLADVMPFVEKTIRLEQMQDYKSLLEVSTSLLHQIKKGIVRSDNLLLAEAFYRSALACYLIDSSDYKHIADYAKEALVISNKAHLLCGSLLVRAGLIQQTNKLKALDLATELADRDPSNANLRALRGEVFDSLNDTKSAIQEYKLAIELKTKDSMVYVNKARIEYLIGQYFSSISTCDAGLKVFPHNMEIYYQKILSEEKLAMYYKAGNDFEVAQSYGMKGSMMDTIVEHGNLYFETGLTFFDRNENDTAIIWFDRSYKFSGNLSALFFRGYTFMKINKNIQALNDLNTLIFRDSTFKHAYYMRGLVNTASDDNLSAISDFESQIKLTPAYWKSYAQCGGSLQKLGRYKEAANLFSTSNQVKYADSIAAKAVYAFYLAGEYEQAIKLGDTYIDQNKTRYNLIYKYKGMSEYRATAFDDARTDLADALQSIPEDYETTLFMAKNYIALGESERAIQYSEKAIQICKNCPEALAWSGISIISQQQSTEIEPGISKIRAAIDKDSRLMTGANLAWIAYAYLINRNDMNVFRSALESAINIDPTDPVVLFVTASYKAENPIDWAVAMKLLDQACAMGFFYKHLIQKDPTLRRCKNDLQYKAIMQRYFFD